jgi:hypothetical protein
MCRSPTTAIKIKSGGLRLKYFVRFTDEYRKADKILVSCHCNQRFFREYSSFSTKIDSEDVKPVYFSKFSQIFLTSVVKAGPGGTPSPLFDMRRRFSWVTPRKNGGRDVKPTTDQRLVPE